MGDGWELSNVRQVWHLLEDKMQISFAYILCMGRTLEAWLPGAEEGGAETGKSVFSGVV